MSEEKPYTTPTAVPGPRHSPLVNILMAYMEQGAPLPPQSQSHQSRTLPQPITPITIAQALYLLATGKLVRIPDVLLLMPLEILFNHFLEELVADQDWTRTPAGIDYAYYGYSYILKEEATHFTCQAYNMIHRDHPIQVSARYRRPQIDLPPITYTPEPMEDELPVLPQWAAIPDYVITVQSYAQKALSYVYPRGYGLPGTQGPPRLFAAAEGDVRTSNQPPPPSKPQPPAGPPLILPVIPQRWAPP